MPVTGIPLPLVSYGGSSVVAFLVMLGLVQSVHIRRNS
jgi:rod shape determining protein RodA